MDLSELASAPALVFSPHPLMPSRERELVYAHFLPGETIAGYLERTGLAARMGSNRFILTIDGRRLPRSLWRVCRPKPGTLINIYAIVGSEGEGGKNPLRTIAMIAVLVVAAWAGPYFFQHAAGTFSLGATLTTAGVGVLGGMLVNQVFPLPRQIATGQDESPTYALQGGSNRARPYEAMPKICGKPRVFPDFGAAPFTEFQGEDQYLNMVFDFGYNDLVLSEHKIGATPIEDFTGVQLEESGPDGKLLLFPGNVDSVGGGELKEETSWVSRTSSPNATAIGLEFTGVLFRVSDKGDVFPLELLLEIQVRAVGAPDWTPVELADDTVPELHPFLAGFRQIRMRHEELLRQTLIPGQLVIVHGRRTPLKRGYTFLVEEGQYEVRVRRLTPDFSPNDKHNFAEVVWSQMRTYQPDTADYTGRKRVALRIRASGQLSGVVQEYNCVAAARTTVYGGGHVVDLNNGNLVAGQGVQVLHAPILSQPSVSIELRFELTGPLNVDGNNNYRSFIRKGSILSTITGWDVVLEQTGSVNWDTGHGATDRQAAAIGAAIGEPMHLVFTYDATTGTKKVYKNGVPIATKVAPAGGLTSNETDLFIGYGTSHVTNPIGNGDTPGKYDDVRYYGKALSDAEVAEHYAGLYRDESQLVGRWQFDEGQGTTATDDSGHGNDGTLIGDPPWAPGAPEVPRIAATSSPAWWVLDGARGKSIAGRRVFGALTPESRIDLENLKAFAAWCTEKELTFDGVFDRQMSVFELLSAIALCGRGTLSRATGKLGVVWDAPDLPVKAVFSMSNIKLDSFEVDYATGNLADEVIVAFDNPELGIRDTVRAPVPGAANPGSRSREVYLFGCRVKDMAGRAANLYAAQNAYRTKRYRFRTDWDGMPAARGDVVKLAHDLTSFDYSGRLIEGSSANTLKLPRLVPLSPGGAFVTIVKPDGSFATYSVAAGAGDSDTLTLLSALPFDPGADPEHPPYDYRWLYGFASTPGRKVKIESWVPKGYDSIEISAFDELPEYYAAESNPFVYVPPRPVFGAPEISNLQITEDGVRAGTGYLVEVTATWDTGVDYDHAEVHVAVDGGPLELKGETRGHSLTFTVTDGVHVQVDVTAYSTLRRLGKKAKASLEKTIGFAALSPPDDLTGFALDGRTFRWKPATAVDVVGYRIRFQYGHNRSFTDAALLHEGLLPYSPKEFPVLPAGTVTFFGTAVDAAGRESETPAIIVKGLPFPDFANIVEEIDFEALGWPGSLAGGALVGDDLEADGTTEFYGADAGPLYGADAAPFYEDEVYSELVYESAIFYFQNKWIGSSMWLEHEIEGEAVTVEWRQTNAEDFYGADADDFYGEDADAFYGADGEYRSWPGAVTFEGGDYQLRITAAAGPIQGAVRELAVIIDVPDITETLVFVLVEPGGTRLAITKEYEEIRNVQLTLQDDGGDAVSARVLDLDAALGPLVETIDGAKVQVTGRVNAFIQGR